MHELLPLLNFWSSHQFSSIMSNTLWPHEPQHARPPCPSPTHVVYSDSCPSSRWCHPTISSHRSLLLPPIPPSIRVFSNESTLHMRWPKYWEFQLQHQSFQWTPRTDLFKDGLVGSPCSPRDSQESSPTQQFKSINFSVLSFHHSPTLMFILDHWKKHSLD